MGFRGLADYPDLARRLSDRMDERGYTCTRRVDLGLSPGVARALWAAFAVGLLAATVVLARRGEERRAFVLAFAAAIAFSPIVWLHYFALLLVVVAVVQPRLAPIWFVGLPPARRHDGRLQRLDVPDGGGARCRRAHRRPRPAAARARAEAGGRQLAGRSTIGISSSR